MGGKRNFKRLSDKHRLLSEIAKAPIPTEQARIEDVPEHIDRDSIPKAAMNLWSKRTKVSVKAIKRSVAPPKEMNLVRCQICRFDVPVKDLARHLRDLHPGRALA